MDISRSYEINASVIVRQIKDALLIQSALRTGVVDPARSSRGHNKPFEQSWGKQFSLEAEVIQELSCLRRQLH